MNKFHITEADVQQVAKDVFEKKLTKKQVRQILQDYPDAQDQDPTGSWDLVVENQIYGILDDEE